MTHTMTIYEGSEIKLADSPNEEDYIWHSELLKKILVVLGPLKSHCISG